MRLDKFLKISRLIKRRTVAQDACKGDRVTVNGREVKPAYRVKVGDIIEITFHNRATRVRVKQLSEHVGANEADTLYEIIDGGEF